MGNHRERAETSAIGDQLTNNADEQRAMSIMEEARMKAALRTLQGKLALLKLKGTDPDWRSSTLAEINEIATIIQQNHRQLPKDVVVTLENKIEQMRQKFTAAFAEIREAPIRTKRKHR